MSLSSDLHVAGDEITQEREASGRKVRLIGVARWILGLVLLGLVIALWVSLWMPPVP